MAKPKKLTKKQKQEVARRKIEKKAQSKKSKNVFGNPVMNGKY